MRRAIVFVALVGILVGGCTARPSDDDYQSDKDGISQFLARTDSSELGTVCVRGNHESDVADFVEISENAELVVDCSPGTFAWVMQTTRTFCDSCKKSERFEVGILFARAGTLSDCLHDNRKCVLALSSRGEQKIDESHDDTAHRLIVRDGRKYYVPKIREKTA